MRLGASLFIAATLVGTRIFEKLLEVGREMLGKIAAQVDRRFEKLRNYAWNSYGSKLPEQVDPGIIYYVYVDWKRLRIVAKCVKQSSLCRVTE